MSERWSPSFTHNLGKTGFPQVAAHKSGQQDLEPGIAHIHPSSPYPPWGCYVLLGKVTALLPLVFQNSGSIASLGPRLHSPHSPEKSLPDLPGVSLPCLGPCRWLPASTWAQWRRKKRALLCSGFFPLCCPQESIGRRRLFSDRLWELIPMMFLKS